MRGVQQTWKNGEDGVAVKAIAFANNNEAQTYVIVIISIIR